MTRTSSPARWWPLRGSRKDGRHGIGAAGNVRQEDRVYRLLLGQPRLSLQQLTVAAGWRQDRCRAVLRALESKGLISRVPTPDSVGYVAARPDIAFAGLLLRRQEDLARGHGVVDKYLRDFWAGAQATPSRLVEVIEGREAIAQRFEQLQRYARDEILGIDRPPYAVDPADNLTEFEQLEAGVRYRYLHDRTSFDDPAHYAHVRRAVAAGEQARVGGDLPLKLAIADRELALVPLMIDEPGVRIAVLLEPSALIDGLVALFEVLWERATPFFAGETAEHREGPTGDDLAVLQLLAAGLKDEAIARQLGLSLRTVRRKISTLLAALGAGTRFAAGLQAGRRGWL